MNTVQQIAHTIMTVLSIVTAFGVFMHDGRVDRAVTTSLYRPFDVVSNNELTARMRSFVETDAHTHPDHSAVKNTLLSSFAYQSPSVPPRREAHHKYTLKQIENGGRHAFDNVDLPVLD
jgi:hypothetical protein